MCLLNNAASTTARVTITAQVQNKVKDFVTVVYFIFYHIIF